MACCCILFHWYVLQIHVVVVSKHLHWTHNNVISLIIFKVRTDCVFCLYGSPYRRSSWMKWLLVFKTKLFSAPISTIVLIYVPINVKMGLDRKQYIVKTEKLFQHSVQVQSSRRLILELFLTEIPNSRSDSSFNYISTWTLTYTV